MLGHGEFGEVFEVTSLKGCSIIDKGIIPPPLASRPAVKNRTPNSILLDRSSPYSSPSTHHRKNLSSVTFVELGDFLALDGPDLAPLAEPEYLASHCQVTGGVARYALKRMRKGASESSPLNAVLDLACEAKFLASITHSNIIGLRGLVGEPGNLDFAILMDRLTGTLTEKLVEWKASRQKLRQHWFGDLFRPNTNNIHKNEMKELLVVQLFAAFDIARAMRHLHDKKLLYRDLKPDNIGFNVTGDVVLFDFGLAKELRVSDLVEPPDGYELTGLTGSRRFMAPECARCLPYGLSADVYSFSILLYQILTLMTPFKTLDHKKHVELVIMKGRRPKLGPLSHVPAPLSKLIQVCWSENPEKRPDFKTICSELQAEIRKFHHAENPSSASVGDRTVYLMNRSVSSDDCCLND
jgi:serine/threonine protein kinase